MKIVHICAQYSDGWGYQENLLSKYHTRLGHDVTVISSTFAYDTNQKMNVCEKSGYKDGQVKVIRLKDSLGRGYRNKFRNMKGLEEQLGEEKPEIIFLHGIQFVYVREVCRYVKKHSSTKVFVDNHADFNNSASNFMSKYILHGVIWKHMAHRIDPYVTKWYGVLPARVEFLQDVYGLPAEKTELLVMGADDDAVLAASSPEMKAEIREHYGIAEDDFLITTGGKITHDKKLVIKLMETVNRMDNPKVKLIVFGSVVPELKESLENNCSDRVRFIGWVTSEKAYSYFAASEIVVFPGKHSVFWEQVAGLGIPMICSYYKGMTHIDVGGNVLFLKHDSENEMENILIDLLDNKDKYEKMKHAAKKGMDIFSYESIAERSIRNAE